MTEAGLISIGALSMLLALFGLALWKTRGFRIELGGVRFVDARVDETERQLKELREVERRATHDGNGI